MVTSADCKMAGYILTAFLCSVGLLRLCEAVSTQPLLLVVIFDGFRWDYMDRFHLPSFEALAASGVRAGRVLNVMPTLTMASHYTMLTGLYPETHGMILNDFHDPVLGDYNMYDQQQQTESKWFDNGAEPIWVTNQKAASNRFSAAMTWPTALAPVMGVAPTYQRGPLYDPSIKNRTRIDTTIQWFLHPKQPVNLGLLYFDEPDLIGHAFGPNSVQIEQTLTALDKELDYLIGQLKKNGLFEPMNIIVTADHGMADIPKHQFINISEFVSRDLYDDYGLSSVGLIHPKPGREEEVYEGLRKVEQKHPQVHVYRKTDGLLKALNYSRIDRIGPIVLVAEEGWYLVNKEEQLVKPDRGLHGYPPTLPSMHPFFLARGPAFRTGYFTPTLRSIDLYELMCHLLELNPAPNNGSMSNIKHILQSEAEDYTTTYIAWLTAVLVIVFAALLGRIIFLKTKDTTRRKKTTITHLD